MTWGVATKRARLRNVTSQRPCCSPKKNEAQATSGVGQQDCRIERRMDTALQKRGQMEKKLLGLVKVVAALAVLVSVDPSTRHS